MLRRQVRSSFPALFGWQGSPGAPPAPPAQTPTDFDFVSQFPTPLPQRKTPEGFKSLEFPQAQIPVSTPTDFDFQTPFNLPVYQKRPDASLGTWQLLEPPQLTALPKFDFYSQFSQPARSRLARGIEFKDWPFGAPASVTPTPTDFDFYQPFEMPPARQVVRIGFELTPWALASTPVAAQPGFGFYMAFEQPKGQQVRREGFLPWAWGQASPSTLPSDLDFYQEFKQPGPRQRAVALVTDTAWTGQVVAPPPPPPVPPSLDFPAFALPRKRVYFGGTFEFMPWSLNVPTTPKAPVMINVGIQATLVLTVNDPRHQPFAQAQKAVLPMIKFQGTISPTTDLAAVSVLLQQQVDAQCQAWVNELSEMEKGRG